MYDKYLKFSSGESVQPPALQGREEEKTNVGRACQNRQEAARKKAIMESSIHAGVKEISKRRESTQSKTQQVFLFDKPEGFFLGVFSSF